MHTNINDNNKKKYANNEDEKIKEGRKLESG